MKHKNISRQGVNSNEDCAFSCEQFIFVADGATGLTNKKYTNCESDARWFTQRLGVLLQERLYNTDKTIGNIVSEIINELRAEYDVFLSGEECDIVAMPSSGISILRLNGEKIEIFQLGDCMTMLLKKDDTVEVFIEEALPKLDAEVIQNIVKISYEKKITCSDALVYVKDQLIHNRKKLNKPDGYWTLDLSGVGIDNAYENSFPVCEMRAAAVMTDGFAEITDLFKLYDYSTLMKKFESEDLETLCDELFKAQDTDPTLDKYPRFKLRDDTSVAWFMVS